MEFTKEEIKTLIESKINNYTIQHGKEFRLAILDILSLERMLPKELEAPIKDEVIELSKWNKHYEFPTVGSLRQSYHNRKKNGFDYCVEYGGDNGGRILINVRKYNEWRYKRSKQKIN